MTCNTKHPELHHLACVLTTTTHPFHMATTYQKDDTGSLVPDRVRWPNEEYRSTAQIREQGRQAHLTVTRVAGEARAAMPRKETKPLRSRSAQGRVAAYMLEHVGEWIPGRRFVDPMAVDGGAAGLRRVRALRTDYGWAIEERPDPDPNTFVSQYRLAERPLDAEIL